MNQTKHNVNIICKAVGHGAIMYAIRSVTSFSSAHCDMPMRPQMRLVQANLIKYAEIFESKTPRVIRAIKAFCSARTEAEWSKKAAEAQRHARYRAPCKTISKAHLWYAITNAFNAGRVNKIEAENISDGLGEMPDLARTYRAHGAGWGVGTPPQGWERLYDGALYLRVERHAHYDHKDTAPGLEIRRRAGVSADYALGVGQSRATMPDGTTQAAYIVMPDGTAYQNVATHSDVYGAQKPGPLPQGAIHRDRLVWFNWGSFKFVGAAPVV